MSAVVKFRLLRVAGLAISLAALAFGFYGGRGNPVFNAIIAALVVVTSIKSVFTCIVELVEGSDEVTETEEEV